MRENIKMPDLFTKCKKFTAAREVIASGYYPYFQRIETAQGPEVIIDGKKKIVCCSNNYLGLTLHPKVKKAAIDAINEATSVIEAGKAAGKDTVDAEAKLAEAQAAYDSGDPDLAESLARESIELIKEPQAEEQPEEDQTEEATEESTEEKGTDYSMILYLVGAIIILFLLYKFVLKGRKGYRK